MRIQWDSLGGRASWVNAVGNEAKALDQLADQLALGRCTVKEARKVCAEERRELRAMAKGAPEDSQLYKVAIAVAPPVPNRRDDLQDWLAGAIDRLALQCPAIPCAMELAHETFLAHKDELPWTSTGIGPRVERRVLEAVEKQLGLLLGASGPCTVPDIGAACEILKEKLAALDPQLKPRTARVVPFADPKLHRDGSMTTKLQTTEMDRLRNELSIAVHTTCELSKEDGPARADQVLVGFKLKHARELLDLISKGTVRIHG